MGMIPGVDQVISAGLGLALEGHNDRRQINQQKRLNELSLDQYKKQSAFQKGLDLQMWKDTNYSAQVQELEKAGLNPALLYGMSGGGGVTTGGGGSGGNAAGAPQGGGEIMGLQLMAAQKELLEAQAKKANADADKTAGVDTNLTKWQGKVAELQASMLHDTYEGTYGKIMAEAETAEQQMRVAIEQGKIAPEKANLEIQTMKAELVGVAITNELRKSEKNLTDQQINQSVEWVKQRWREVAVQEGRLKLEKFVRDIADSTRLTVETATKVVGAVLNKMDTRRDEPKSEYGWSEKTGEWWKKKE